MELSEMRSPNRFGYATREEHLSDAFAAPSQ
jgi:hypothetical protein